MAQKVCTKCKRSLPEQCFHLDAYRPGGRKLRCADCIKARYASDPEMQRRARERAAARRAALKKSQEAA